MNNYLTLLLVFVIIQTAAFKSPNGSRAVALIAEKYLTQDAKAEVKKILGNDMLAGIGTLDYDINNTKHKNTRDWHFVKNLQPDLTDEQFTKAICNQTGDNILTAIKQMQNKLSDERSSFSDKNEALKFLVQLVADAHRPMHVTRAGDVDPNNIHVQFMGKGTNLFSVWESEIMGQAVSEEQLVSKLTKGITHDDEIEYQSTQPVKWLYESYSLSTQVYNEVAKNNKLDEQYYVTYSSIIEERLIAGGLRLAGILNEIFTLKTPASEKTLITNIHINPDMKFIEVNDASNHIGDIVSLTAKVYDVKVVAATKELSIGAASPSQLLTVVLKDGALNKSNVISGKTIRVEGKIVDNKGKPQIIITDADGISIVNLEMSNK